MQLLRNIIFILSASLFACIMPGCADAQKSEQSVDGNSRLKAKENVDHAWNDLRRAYRERSELFFSIPNTLRSLKIKDLAPVADSLEQALRERTDTVISAEPGKESMNRYIAAQNRLPSGLGILLPATEDNDTLLSSEAMRTLQSELEGAENRIFTMIKKFNSRVEEYNTLVEEKERLLPVKTGRKAVN